MEGDLGGGCPIIDYRKSRKLIKELSKKADEFVRLDMSGYRTEFDIFMSVANARAAAIRRFFMENNELFCEFEDGKVLGEKSVNLNEFGELKRLIWWKSDER